MEKFDAWIYIYREYNYFKTQDDILKKNKKNKTIINRLKRLIKILQTDHEIHIKKKPGNTWDPWQEEFKRLFKNGGAAPNIDNNEFNKAMDKLWGKLPIKTRIGKGIGSIGKTILGQQIHGNLRF